MTILLTSCAIVTYYYTRYPD